MSIESEKLEAREAGERALLSLREARNALGSAGNWGLLDLFVSNGGGFLSTIMKHSKLNSAKSALERARYDLDVFNRELKDVSMDIQGIEMSDFLTFFDFMDSFIAEIMVQKKISDMKYAVDRAINQVEGILRRLY
ncbi:MAG: hypothetical protein K6F82_01955 [Sphaerochaetaceae bacterium]|nr:hypothetical protein [Sphaerochaetaceae bacterium]